jgi:curved DNA-binding protein
VTKVGDYQYIKNEGMPIYNQDGKFGNLFVYYFIEFPKALSDHQKQVVRDLFPAA